jgi:hypothetical protein
MDWVAPDDMHERIEKLKEALKYPKKKWVISIN